MELDFENVTEDLREKAFEELSEVCRNKDGKTDSEAVLSALEKALHMGQNKLEHCVDDI